jgi:ABC-type lipoprotein release transport system permease subunit
MRGMQEGIYGENIRTAVEIFSGYLQIQDKGYLDNPSLTKTFRADSELLSILNSQKEIKQYTKRVYANGLASFKDNSFPALIVGVEPEKESGVTTISQKINEGSFIDSDSSISVVLGYKLLKNLQAGIGDNIIILAQGYDGSLGNMKFNICGTVKAGSPDLDEAGVIIGLKTAQDLTSLYGRISSIAISLNNFEAIEDVQESINSKIDTSIAAFNWKEILPELKESIELDNISGLMFLAILIIIVAFGILNTVLMSVTERFKEFGIALAIGMPQLKLVAIILIETIFITLIGVIAGNILAYGVNYYLVANPVILEGNYGALYEEYGFLPLITSSVQIGVFIKSTIVILVSALFAGLYPAYKVYRLEPLKGLRYT